jgi:hypothetical protein
MAFVAGDPIAARAIAEEGRDLADAIGDRFDSRQCRWRLAGAQMMQADLVGAIAQFRELVAEAETDHDGMLRVTILFVVPHVLAYLGDAHGARVAADAAIEAAADVGDLYVGAGYIALMVVALAVGDVALAADAAEAAWPHVSSYREIAAMNMPYVAQVALIRGDLTLARRFADDAIAATSGWWRAYALTTRAHVAIAQGWPPTPAVTWMLAGFSALRKRSGSAPARSASTATKPVMKPRLRRFVMQWATETLMQPGPRVPRCQRS